MAIGHSADHRRVQTHNLAPLLSRRFSSVILEHLAICSSDLYFGIEGDLVDLLGRDLPRYAQVVEFAIYE